MKKKEIKLTRDLLAEKGASDLGIEEFERWYPYGHVPLSEVFRKLQELASTSIKYVEYLKYVSYVKSLISHFPPTQEPLVLNELTEKVIFWNGDIDIYSDVDGKYTIICNGELNIKGGANLTGQGYLLGKTIKAINIAADGNAGISAWKTIDAINIEVKDFAGINAKTIDAEKIAAKDYAVIRAWKTIKAINITANDRAKIFTNKTIDVKNITANDFAEIWAEKTIDAVDIVAYGHSGISADKTIKAINIAAYGYSGINAYEINTINIIDGDGKRIDGKINLINPPQTNQQNTNTAS